MADEKQVEHDRLHNTHEHLRHDATSDDPEIVREHLRREELAKKRDLEETEEKVSAS